jgi:hypothetical protein
MNMQKCMKCGGKPSLVIIDDCFYVQCQHCNKWNPYQFLGYTRDGVISQWNTANATKDVKKINLSLQIKKNMI